MSGMSSRVIATIVVVIAWLSFVILYLAFGASGLSLFQSIAIFIVSVLVLGGLMAVLWVSWGMKMAKKMAEEDAPAEKKAKKK